MVYLCFTLSLQHNKRVEARRFSRAEFEIRGEGPHSFFRTIANKYYIPSLRRERVIVTPKLNCKYIFHTARSS